MPFALNKEAVHSALDTVTRENLSHFNAYCPRCRKANRISRDRLERAAPDWTASEPEKQEEEEAPSE
jgi:hypothetical protein